VPRRPVIPPASIVFSLYLFTERQRQSLLFPHCTPLSFYCPGGPVAYKNASPYLFKGAPRARQRLSRNALPVFSWRRIAPRLQCLSSRSSPATEHEWAKRAGCTHAAPFPWITWRNWLYAAGVLFRAVVKRVADVASSIKRREARTAARKPTFRPSTRWLLTPPSGVPRLEWVMPSPMTNYIIPTQNAIVTLTLEARSLQRAGL
jgi:hypothetical protein